jgi:hypothetical protein
MPQLVQGYNVSPPQTRSCRSYSWETSGSIHQTCGTKNRNVGTFVYRGPQGQPTAGLMEPCRCTFFQGCLRNTHVWRLGEGSRARGSPLRQPRAPDTTERAKLWTANRAGREGETELPTNTTVRSQREEQMGGRENVRESAMDHRRDLGRSSRDIQYRK